MKHHRKLGTSYILHDRHMLCHARMDAPVPLHHVIVRGIERREIFYDDLDRDNFLERLGVVLTETGTPCVSIEMWPRIELEKGAWMR